jgi:hypothetical protein
MAYSAGAFFPESRSSKASPDHARPTSAGSCFASSSIAAIASPELRPAAGSPRIARELVPLKRSSFGEPEIQRPVAKAENGTISPLRLRTNQRSASSGCMRNGASACMYTRFVRPLSMKSFT